AFLDELARWHDVPMTRIPVARFQFLTNADAIVHQLETPGVVAHTEAEIFRSARQLGCRVILSGFFGDQMLSDSSYLIDLFRRVRWLKIRHDLREFAAWAGDAEPGDFARDFLSRLVRALPPRWLFEWVKQRTKRRRGHRRYPPWFTPDFR